MSQNDEYEEFPEVSSDNGLFCFLDADRPCSGECMAYTTALTESPALTVQQKNCTLLVSADRLSRSLLMVAKVNKKQMEDAARVNVPMPPDPMGRR